MEHISISSFSESDVISGYYVITDVKIATTRNGNPYLSITVSDQTGKIQAVFWNYNGDICQKDIGKVVFLNGEVGLYRDCKQLTLDDIRLAEADDNESYNIDDLLPTAPIDPVLAMKRINNHIAFIRDLDYQGIVCELILKNEEIFSTIPAGKSIHHSFRHGLLMHTLGVADLAEALAMLYGDLNQDLLIAGALLHDVGKIREFVLSDTGLVIDYSTEGQLLGHPAIGARQVAEVAKELGVPEAKSQLLQHLILSHHGTPEHGAAIVPICLESEMLAAADMIDSRIEIYREQFSDMCEGEFSPYLHALNKRIYKHAG